MCGNLEMAVNGCVKHYQTRNDSNCMVVVYLMIIELHYKPVQQEKKTLVSCTYMYVVQYCQCLCCSACCALHIDRQTIPDRFGRLAENAYKLQSSSSNLL